MAMEKLVGLLASALRPDGCRESAEAQLLSMEGQEEYMQLLAVLITSYRGQMDESVRSLAAVQLKNNVVKVWRHASYSAQWKLQMREAVLSQAMIEPNSTIRLVLQEVVSKMARFDFPELWPSLIEDILLRALDETDLRPIEDVPKSSPRALLLLYKVLRELDSKRLIRGREIFGNVSHCLIPVLIPVLAARLDVLLSSMSEYARRRELTASGGADTLRRSSEALWTPTDAARIIWIKYGIKLLDLCLCGITQSLQDSPYKDAITYVTGRTRSLAECVLNVYPLPFSSEFHSLLKSCMRFLLDIVENKPSEINLYVGNWMDFHLYLVVGCVNLDDERIPDYLRLSPLKFFSIMLDSCAFWPKSHCRPEEALMLMPAYEIMQTFFTRDVLVQMINAIVLGYARYSKAELESWMQEPEVWMLAERSSAWLLSVRASADRLMVGILTRFTSEEFISAAPLVIESIGTALQRSRLQTAPEAVLLRESCYLLLSSSWWSLSKFVDFNHIFAAYVQPEVYSEVLRPYFANSGMDVPSSDVSKNSDQQSAGQAAATSNFVRNMGTSFSRENGVTKAINAAELPPRLELLVVRQLAKLMGNWVTEYSRDVRVSSYPLVLDMLTCSDIVVRVAACEAFGRLLGDNDFNVEDVGTEHLGLYFERSFELLVQAESSETKLVVALTVERAISSVVEFLKPLALGILDALVYVWRHAMIFGSMVQLHIVRALVTAISSHWVTDTAMVMSAAFPPLVFGTNVEEEPFVYLRDDILGLWAVSLEVIESVPDSLISLYSNLNAQLRLSYEALEPSSRVLSAYVVAGGQPFISRFGADFVKFVCDTLGEVRDPGTALVVEPMLWAVRAMPQLIDSLYSPVVYKVLKLLLSCVESDLSIISYLGFITRIIYYNPSLCLALVDRLVLEDVLVRTKEDAPETLKSIALWQNMKNAKNSAVLLLELLIMKADYLTALPDRKMLLLSICTLMALPGFPTLEKLRDVCSVVSGLLLDDSVACSECLKAALSGYTPQSQYYKSALEIYKRDPAASVDSMSFVTVKLRDCRTLYGDLFANLLTQSVDPEVRKLLPGEFGLVQV